jgi:hypothetical protein
LTPSPSFLIYYSTLLPSLSLSPLSVYAKSVETNFHKFNKN